jgi:hypothetical protein
VEGIVAARGPQSRQEFLVKWWGFDAAVSCCVVPHPLLSTCVLPFLQCTAWSDVCTLSFTPSPPPPPTHTRTHSLQNLLFNIARCFPTDATRAHTRTRTRTYMHTHAHTQSDNSWEPRSGLPDNLVAEFLASCGRAGTVISVFDRRPYVASKEAVHCVRGGLLDATSTVLARVRVRVRVRVGLGPTTPSSRLPPNTHPHTYMASHH